MKAKNCLETIAAIIAAPFVTIASIGFIPSGLYMSAKEKIKNYLKGEDKKYIFKQKNNRDYNLNIYFDRKMNSTDVNIMIGNLDRLQKLTSKSLEELFPAYWIPKEENSQFEKPGLEKLL